MSRPAPWRTCSSTWCDGVRRADHACRTRPEPRSGSLARIAVNSVGAGSGDHRSRDQQRRAPDASLWIRPSASRTTTASEELAATASAYRLRERISARASISADEQSAGADERERHEDRRRGEQRHRVDVRCTSGGRRAGSRRARAAGARISSSPTVPVRGERSRVGARRAGPVERGRGDQDVADRPSRCRSRWSNIAGSGATSAVRSLTTQRHGSRGDQRRTRRGLPVFGRRGPAPPGRARGRRPAGRGRCRPGRTAGRLPSLTNAATANCHSISARHDDDRDHVEQARHVVAAPVPLERASSTAPTTYDDGRHDPRDVGDVRGGCRPPS